MLEKKVRLRPNSGQRSLSDKNNHVQNKQSFMQDEFSTYDVKGLSLAFSKFGKNISI